jgi:hypothetical protein
MEKLNSIKERMDGHFEVGTLYHEVEIHGFPGNGDTETLRELLRIIDPEMDANDLEQTADSTIFYGQLMITEGPAACSLQDTKNLKAINIRFTQKFLEWGCGARDTGHAAADKLVLYKNYRQGGGLTSPFTLTAHGQQSHSGISSDAVYSLCPGDTAPQSRAISINGVRRSRQNHLIGGSHRRSPHQPLPISGSQNGSDREDSDTHGA